MARIAAFPVFPSVVELIAKALPEDDVIRVERAGPYGAAADAEIAFGNPLALAQMSPFLDAAPRLRWIHSAGAGVENLLVPELRQRRDLVLTNNSGAADIAIAEFALAVMLSAAKQIPSYVKLQESHKWEPPLEHAELQGSTVVVLGLGSIGGAFARLAGALDMEVIGVRRRPDESDLPAGVRRVVGQSDLPSVAREADFLVITVPLTPATRGIVSAEIIAALKPSAWVINMARGPVVDERALLDALRSSKLGGAALDVWWQEPLQPDSVWWSVPNVIATPHVSYASPYLTKRTLDTFLENVRRYKQRLPLLNVVDVSEGY